MQRRPSAAGNNSARTKKRPVRIRTSHNRASSRSLDRIIWKDTVVTSDEQPFIRDFRAPVSQHSYAHGDGRSAQIATFLKPWFGPPDARLLKSQLCAGVRVTVLIDGSPRVLDLVELTGDVIAASSPVRRPGRHSDMPNKPGTFFSSTNRDLVQYESQLEEEFLYFADFDPLVLGIRAQPFSLWGLVDGKVRKHTPDFALLCRDGSVRIVNVKPESRIHDVDVGDLHDWVEHTIAPNGFVHEEYVGAPRLVVRNLRYIAGARVEQWMSHYPRAQVFNAWKPGDTIGALERRLSSDFPQAVIRASIRNLLWNSAFRTDLRRSLGTLSPLARS